MVIANGHEADKANKAAKEPTIALPPSCKAPNIAEATPENSPKGSMAPLAPEPAVNAQPKVANILGPKKPHNSVHLTNKQ